METKPWYQQTEVQICSFFDVDPKCGLTKKDALARLARFGPNQDPSLSDAMIRSLKCTVTRESRQESITIKQLVPGDIVFLRTGDRLPADIRLLHVENLRIHQGQLTGEVLPAAKNTFPTPTAVEISQQKSMAFAGTFVASGSGYGVVVARGAKLANVGTSLKKPKRQGIKGSIIARRLKRFGVIIRNKKVLAVFRKISIVIIDAELSDSDITELIRKVQLTRNIVCKFAVTKPMAQRLEKELSVDVYDAESKTGNLLVAQLITGLNTDNSLSAALTLAAMGDIVLWVSDGHQRLRAFSVASISMVIGDGGRDDVILAADTFAPKANATILTRILYGRRNS